MWAVLTLALLICSKCTADFSLTSIESTVVIPFTKSTDTSICQIQVTEDIQIDITGINDLLYIERIIPDELTFNGTALISKLKVSSNRETVYITDFGVIITATDRTVLFANFTSDTTISGITITFTYNILGLLWSNTFTNDIYWEFNFSKYIPYAQFTLIFPSSWIPTLHVEEIHVADVPSQYVTRKTNSVVQITKNDGIDANTPFLINIEFPLQTPYCSPFPVAPPPTDATGGNTLWVILCAVFILSICGCFCFTIGVAIIYKQREPMEVDDPDLPKSGSFMIESFPPPESKKVLSGAVKYPHEELEMIDQGKK
jgi:hypothetical protein